MTANQMLEMIVEQSVQELAKIENLEELGVQPRYMKF